MKKLLSLFGLLGLLAFVATPIYAQEEEAVLDNEPIIAEAEEIDAAVDEFNNDVDEAVENVTEEIAEVEDVIEDTADDVAEDIEAIPSFFEDEEIQNVLDLNKGETTWLWLLAGLWIATWIIGLVWIVLAIIALWKIFERAWEAGWLAIIPIVNVYIMYKIAGMKNWFRYSLIAAFAGWLIAWLLWESSAAGIVSGVVSLFVGIVAIVAAYKLPRKFGWGVFASILYVLFTSIAILILGFGNYKYQWKEESTVVEA